MGGVFSDHSAEYRELTEVLRVLSQTCQAYQAIFLSMLWKRLDLCMVPEDFKTTYYNYVMWEICRKSDGLRSCPNLAKYIE